MADQTLPQTMTAYTSNSPSLPTTPSGLSLKLTTLPLPSPTANQLLIKTTHASLTPGGVILQALLPAWMHTYPSIPELDFAGRVVGFDPTQAKPTDGSAIAASEQKKEEDDEEAEGENGLFKLGDLVFGSIPLTQHFKGAGALAEYIAIPISSISHIPILHDHNPAAIEQQLAAASSLPVSGCTALTLLHASKIEQGMHILINGASGGVGSLILQMGKHVVGGSGTVTAVCSERNREFARALGADEVVAYDAREMEGGVGRYLGGLCVARSRKLAIENGKVLGGGSADVEGLSTEELEAGKFDVVIDAVGKQDIWYSCPHFLKSGEAYVTVGPSMEGWTQMALVKTLGQMVENWLTPTWLGGVGRRYVQVASTVDKKGLRELKRMVDEGIIKGMAGNVWAWHEVGQAYEVMLSRRARGKIVIKVEQ